MQDLDLMVKSHLLRQNTAETKSWCEPSGTESIQDHHKNYLQDIKIARGIEYP